MKGFADLGRRTGTGLAMAAGAAAAVWAGGWAMAGLAAVCAGLMAWELRRMTAGRFDLAGGFAAAAAAAAPLATGADMMRTGLLAAAPPLAAALWLARREGPFPRAALGLGVAYVAVAASALVGLRDDDLYGAAAVVWVALTVVATDVGGYFAGRLFGGPKLWPAVSPGKTWSGLAGAMALAAAVGAAFSAATTGTVAHEVALASAVMALVAQGGDLGESALKRRCGVKDSSGLIPGHGGVMDRMDGLMAAGLVASLISFARSKSVFVW